MINDTIEFLSGPVTRPILMSAISGITGTLGVVALSFQPIDVTSSIVAIGMLCTALGTLYTAIHTARIGGHVDGLATAAAAKRTADEDTIISLKQQLADSDKRAALLAQARTNVDIATAVPVQQIKIAEKK